jgi:hypothetical protein
MNDSPKMPHLSQSKRGRLVFIILMALFATTLLYATVWEYITRGAIKWPPLVASIWFAILCTLPVSKSRWLRWFAGAYFAINGLIRTLVTCYVTYTFMTHTDAPSTDLTIPLALSMCFESLVWLVIGLCLLFLPSIRAFLSDHRATQFDPNAAVADIVGRVESEDHRGS